MLKKTSILVCIFWAGFSTAQNYFNTTISQNPKLSANSGIIELNKDTLVISALSSSISSPVWSQRMIYFTSATTGDTISSIKIRDTTYYSQSVTNDLFFFNNFFYVITYLQKLDSTTTTITKFNRKGQIVWDYIPPFTYLFSNLRSMISLNDSTILLCGEKETSFGNLDIRLVWLDTNGTILNERIYNLPKSQYAFQIDKFKNGDFLLTGGSIIDAVNTFKTFYRLAPNGDVIWQKNIGGNGWNAGLTTLNSDSSIYWTGAFAYPGQTIKPRVLKMNSNGDTLWTYVLPPFSVSQTPEHCSYENVVEAENLGITTLGRFQDTIYNRPTSFLQHLTSEGKAKWLRKISIRTSHNYNSSLIRASNGDYLFTGYVFSDLVNPADDGWLVRVNCIGLFEGPKDSIVIAQNGTNISLVNFANHFAFSQIDWGDSSQIEIQESNYSDSLEKITYSHSYLAEGNYTIKHKTIACNDTLLKTFSISVVNAPFTYNQLTLFPNPTTGIFTLGLAHLGIATIYIYDNTGKIVYKENANLNEGKLLNLEQVSEGLYHLVVEANGEKWKTKMVIQ